MKRAIINYTIPPENPPCYIKAPCCNRCANVRTKWHDVWSELVCKEHKLKVDSDCICLSFKPRAEGEEIEKYVADIVIEASKGDGL